MKRYPKLLQTDARGQIVIPKEVRRALNITDGTGFWAYLIDKEGIFLKKVDAPPLEGNETKALKENGHKIAVDKKNVEKSEAQYRSGKDGVFDDV